MNFCSDKTTILFSLIILIILILLVELKEEYINFPIKTEYKNIEGIKVNIERERVVSYPVYIPTDSEAVIKRDAEVDVNEF